MTPSLLLPSSTCRLLAARDSSPVPTVFEAPRRQQLGAPIRSEAFAEDLDVQPLRVARTPHSRGWRSGQARPALLVAAVAVSAVLTGIVNVLFAAPV